MAQDKLELRKQRKAKKPTFTRQNAHKVSEVSRTGWRKPVGKHSKIRKKHKNKHKMPNPGYCSPCEVRGLLPNGLVPVVVFNLKDLEALNPKSDGVILASSVGMRKRLELVKKAQELKLTIVNVKDAENFVKNYLEERKAAQKSRDAEKEARKKKGADRVKQKEAEEKKKESIDKKVEESADDKKKEAVKEREEKVLTQKQKD